MNRCAFNSGHSRRGFTLVELVVAIVVGVMVAGAVATALFQMLRARGTSLARQQAWSRAESAAGLIAIDLASAARNADALHQKVQILDGGGTASDGLLLLVTSQRPVRGEDWNPEGLEQEAQYRVQPSGGRNALWKRADPGFDEAIDGGGVAGPIVPGISSVSLQAYDGSQWFDAWDSDSDGMPHAVRVVVTAQSDDGTRVATFRRLVAIDRVPLPPAAETDDSNSNKDSSTGSGSSAPSGATGGTGSSGTGGTGGSGRGGTGGAAGSTGGGRPGGTGAGGSGAGASGGGGAPTRGGGR